MLFAEMKVYIPFIFRNPVISLMIQCVCVCVRVCVCVCVCASLMASHKHEWQEIQKRGQTLNETTGFRMRLTNTTRYQFEDNIPLSF